MAEYHHIELWRLFSTFQFRAKHILLSSKQHMYYTLICTLIYRVSHYRGCDSTIYKPKPLKNGQIKIWFLHLMVLKIWLFFLINILVKLHIRWWDALYYIVFTKRGKKSSQELLLTLFHYLFFCSNFFQVRYILQSDM